jgi:Family of unknown function (DUF5681)
MSSTKNPQAPDGGPRQNYEVGYGRPPVATRFQRDNCCNPRGRPKQKKTAGQLIEEAMNSKVGIVVEGKTRTMTKQQVIIHNLVNAAARGDSKAIHTLFGLKARYQDSSETTINPSDLDASDRKIIDEYLAKTSTEGALPERPLADEQRDAVDDLSQGATPDADGVPET